ncbi:TRAP transporter substrate-binding protein DctP [Blastococcus saxobsidens]|uniref:TRAP dicarboxylate transporter-DctP subunit n=1 Tax=Blastococcus saxobsidens (strain DD2) TaxID=1146883 RepID=H6RNQ6_BLASD|nr:TRAP transporter substrate-binding protein DctP [Blastococcus saxobsidens]CCG05204.1 TRAP dicarboxylate transporter-DctP subunit [Blastococcus saxobsidens DD2]
MVKSRKYRTRSVASLVAVSGLALVTACGGGGGDGGSTGADGAEEAVTLKLGDILAENHYISEGFTQPLVEQVASVSEEAGCPVSIDVFPDGQLGEPADEVDNLNSGVFEVGHVAPPYNGDQMPLGNVFNLPRMASDASTLGLAYYDLARDAESEIYKYDFERNNMVPFAAYALPLYQFVTSKPIDGVEALRGLNIRSAGGPQNATVSALGATPVQMTAAEQYEGLQRGIIDGGIFNLPSLISNRTFEVTSHFTTNANVASFNGALVVSQPVWDELSECQQEALLTAGEEATEEFATSLPAVEEETIAQLEAEGLTAVELGAADLEQLDQALSGVADTWLDTLPSDAPGDAALEEAGAAIADRS